MNYYDDNYGDWHDMDDPDMIDFFRQVQRESVKKKCTQCGRIVKIRPEYSICNHCADQVERGI